MYVQVETSVTHLERWFTNRALNLAGGPRTVDVRLRKPMRNVTIAVVQATRDRNPFFLTAAENTRAVRMMAEGLTAFLRTNRLSELHRRLVEVGAYTVAAFQKRIRGRKSAGLPGSALVQAGHRTAPLTPEYAKAKRRKFGRALPELVATGQFIESFYAKVTRS